MTARNQGFPRSSRLTKSPVFRQVYASGNKIFLGPILVIWLNRGNGPCRLGITISKRVAGAVGRNRFKRLTREAFRRLSSTPHGIDLVVIARQGAHRLPAAEVAALVSKAIDRIQAGPSRGRRRRPSASE